MVVRLVAVKLVVVLAMVLVVPQLSVVDSQRTILPVCPERVRTVLLVPEQTVVPPEMLPPTEAFTVTLETTGLAAEHEPLL